MKIYLSHSSNQDYKSDLYGPLKSSTIMDNHKIYFPHDEREHGVNSKSLIQGYHLVIAEVSYPSTGQGIELGWADESNVPIVCLYKTGSQTSSSLQFISKNLIEYNDSTDMIEKIENWLIVHEEL